MPSHTVGTSAENVTFSWEKRRTGPPGSGRGRIDLMPTVVAANGSPTPAWNMGITGSTLSLGPDVEIGEPRNRVQVVDCWV